MSKRYEFGKMKLTQIPGVDAEPTMRFSFEMWLTLPDDAPYEVSIPVPNDGTVGPLMGASSTVNPFTFPEPPKLVLRRFRKTRVEAFPWRDAFRYVYVET